MLKFHTLYTYNISQPEILYLWFFTLAAILLLHKGCHLLHQMTRICLRIYRSRQRVEYLWIPYLSTKTPLRQVTEDLDEHDLDLDIGESAMLEIDAFLEGLEETGLAG